MHNTSEFDHIRMGSLRHFTKEAEQTHGAGNGFFEERIQKKLFDIIRYEKIQRGMDVISTIMDEIEEQLTYSGER